MGRYYKRKAIDFYKERHVYPNILLANMITFERIDTYLKKHPENLYWDGFGEPLEFDGLSSFSTSHYTLEFCIDNSIKKNTFRLVHDETPTFDGEEHPFSTNKNRSFSFRKAA